MGVNRNQKKYAKSKKDSPNLYIAVKIYRIC